jgi:CII-binding regulator of phage lambda lysogenization HflD
MMTIKNPTSIKNTLERLETILKELSISVSEVEDRLTDIEHQQNELLSSVESMFDNTRSCIGDDIQSAVSEINSNTDQLKD